MKTENRADNRSGSGLAGVDRRRDPRVRTDLFVNRFLNGHPYLCRMTNISRSGACLVAVNEPRITPPPAVMGLQFQLPGRTEVVTALGEAIDCDAPNDEARNSVRSGRRSVRIRFTHVPARAASVIDAAIGVMLTRA
jgi:PilZ domain